MGVGKKGQNNVCPAPLWNVLQKGCVQDFEILNLIIELLAGNESLEIGHDVLPWLVVFLW